MADPQPLSPVMEKKRKAASEACWAETGYRGRLNHGWPVIGGLWNCGCGWTGSSDKTVKWERGYECPECGRRDLIQYIDASIAFPIAALHHLLGEQKPDE